MNIRDQYMGNAFCAPILEISAESDPTRIISINLRTNNQLKIMQVKGNN